MEEKIYVSYNQKIWGQILQKNHKLADIEHLEQQSMLELIKRNYWWLGIWNDINKYKYI